MLDVRDVLAPERAGEWTEAFYRSVDLDAPCEPVFLFGSTGGVSPYWQAIAREYMERWVHHSQIRRAIGLRSLAGEPFVPVGVRVAAAAAGVDATHADGRWSLGPVVLGDDQQTADLLTKGHTADEVRDLVSGPTDFVELLATFASR